MGSELAKADRTDLQLAGSQFELRPRNLEEAMRFAELMSKSDLVPSDYRGKPGNIIIAMQIGYEIGLSPMRALKSIAVINGRATMFGDDMLALVQASPAYEWHDESESNERMGVCVVKRKGDPQPYRATFSLEDAKRAGLLGKAGPWTQYTARMLKLRARGFALRDKFADALAGLTEAEEAMDITDTPLKEADSAPSPSLKDRLKAQVEDTPASETEPEADTLISEPTPEPAGDVPADEPMEDPAAPYMAKLRTATSQSAINDVWRTIPDPIKQDCYPTYSDRLKAVATGKRK